MCTCLYLGYSTGKALDETPSVPTASPVRHIDIDISTLLKNIDIEIAILKDNLENINIDKTILENIGIDIDKDYLENINIDKNILNNIDINIDNSTVIFSKKIIFFGRF